MADIRSCCLTGNQTSRVPRGKVEKLGVVDAYIAQPEEPGECAIIIATDVFGLNLPNVKVIADSFADEGKFLTVVPDLFAGGALKAELMEDMLTLMGQGQQQQSSSVIGGLLRKTRGFTSLLTSFPMFILMHPQSRKVSTMESVIKDIKENRSIKKIGMIGYCYGGFFCLQFAKEGTIDAFVTNHTSVKVPNDIEQSLVPGLFVCADKDFAFPLPEVKKAEVLIASRAEGSVEMRLKFYPGTYHGFAVRGDESHPATHAAMEDALKEALNFFSKHLKS
eukprot:TRINITY_DN3627_c0_g2_i1.p1 TRINITY_DN3627_c0_g2~~TRINITY_DN3627_c0_g2_i1.p1  ORF type:complete len:312 (+),score=89.64 TRINITY_DN3627_c0_g2_i1:103-936(+)